MNENEIKMFKVFLGNTNSFEENEKYGDETVIFFAAVNEKVAVEKILRRLNGCDWEGGLEELIDDIDQIGMTYDEDADEWKKGFYRHSTDEWLFTD